MYSTMNVATSNNLVADSTTEIEVAGGNDRQFLDFDISKVQTLTLEQLARTEKENDYNGNPLLGIYHFQLIQQIHIIFSLYSRYRKCAPNVAIVPRYGICSLPTTKTEERLV